MSITPETSPYCPNCGKRILIGEHTCAGCGHPLPQLTATSDAEAQSYLEYAGFWRRVVAYVIDSLLINAAGALLGITAGFLGFRAGWPLEKLQVTMIGPALALPWLYLAGFEASSFQASPGKMAMGIQVTNLRGEPISFLHATGRYLAKIPSGLILSIGFIMAGFTEKKQALHDIIADTLVVRR